MFTDREIKRKVAIPQIKKRSCSLFPHNAAVCGHVANMNSERAFKQPREKVGW
jgi:hypothetical protein